tara:strand:- start:4425 stop:4658 length:234 start_codon:yes stop_codon:yes gene_type:complete
MKHAKFTLKDALHDPSNYYAVPNDVSNDPDFSVEQKREILNAWKLNEEALLRAEDEGLDGGERPHLQLVIAELQRLT